MDDRLGRYRIIRLLARGGVAEIFLARLDGPGGFTRPVVVKRLKSAYRMEPSYRKSLIAEARVGGLLNHPNILQYLELVEANDELFVVTEYLHGVTARELIRAFAGDSDVLPVPLVLHALAEILDGLHYAHTAVDDRGSPLNIVHRDISPENVFFCVSGAVKLMDFGIARTAIGPRDTRVHIIKGKARYFSPEQASGGPIGVASDIYTTGLLLFELLTNHPALDADDERGLVEQARQAEVPDVTMLRSEIPPAVVRLIQKATSRSPEKRYPSALAMMREVSSVLNKLSPHFTVEDLRNVVRDRFAGDLESKRRQIWNDRSTQVVSAAAAMSAEHVARTSSVITSTSSSVSSLHHTNTDTVSDEEGSNAIRDAVMEVERHARRKGQVPRPRYSPELVEDLRSSTDADAPPTEPLPIELEEHLDQPDDTETDLGRQVNLERLRRAITEAYED